MIVNHKYKFIFLKVSKAAGSSTEAFLRKFCQEGDVVTPLTKQEEYEIQSLGLCPPMGFKKIRGQASIIDRVNIALGDKKTIKKCCIYAHSSASDVKEYVGDDIWNSYYKFCILRDPVDRVLSQYFWTAANKSWGDSVSDFNLRFEKFLESRYFEVLKYKSQDIVAINGKSAVDYIIDYRQLEKSLAEIINHLGIDCDEIILPRFKSVQRPPGEFQKFINTQQRDLIMRTFDFEARLLEAK